MKLSPEGLLSRALPWLLLAALWAAAPRTHAALQGDVNLDGRVTVSDAVDLIRKMGGSFLPYDASYILSDIHPWNPTGEGFYQNGRWYLGNSFLNKGDVVEVLRVAVGLAPARDVGPVVYTAAGTGPSYPNTDIDSKEGYGTDLFLFAPWELDVSPAGYVYFTENNAHRVRVLSPTGSVWVLSGGPNPGFRDGPKNRARFKSPEGIALYRDGNLAVADTYNHAIRRVTVPWGDVTTLGGNGIPGYKDGPPSESQFDEPNGVATDPAGNVYVADTKNNRIRKITPDGMTATIAGDGEGGYTDGPALKARLYQPTGVEFDPRDGGLFIADMGNSKIRKLTAAGELVTVAGGGGSNRSGFKDGYGKDALFWNVYCIDLDPRGRLWIADWTNEAVRVMSPDGYVSTVAGSPPLGLRDGRGPNAKFFGLMSVRAAPNGLLYIADTDNQRIRILIP